MGRFSEITERVDRYVDKYVEEMTVCFLFVYSKVSVALEEALGHFITIDDESMLAMDVYRTEKLWENILPLRMSNREVFHKSIEKSFIFPNDEINSRGAGRVLDTVVEDSIFLFYLVHKAMTPFCGITQLTAPPFRLEMTTLVLTSVKGAMRYPKYLTTPQLPLLCTLLGQLRSAELVTSILDSPPGKGVRTQNNQHYLILFFSILTYIFFLCLVFFYFTLI
ncbi:unnamed protein product [Protopolystoma xenopodis]|uniref:Uncharacterized protein n=1 Tax=Protopolystoma xenopodis TaxID=117903 RepID=A0A448XI68_9PLAT|nr:unnamed protein product [Protopolystoma xenopodis]